jgi:hypothetical protein
MEQIETKTVTESATIIYVDFSNFNPGENCKTAHLVYNINRKFWNTFNWHQKLRFRIWIWLSGKSYFRVIGE